MISLGHYLFLWLRSFATGNRTPISRMRANALPVRHRGGQNTTKIWRILIPLMGSGMSRLENDGRWGQTLMVLATHRIQFIRWTSLQTMVKMGKCCSYFFNNKSLQNKHITLPILICWIVENKMYDVIKGLGSKPLRHFWPSIVNLSYTIV